jgi:hypothetical protein
MTCIPTQPLSRRRFVPPYGRGSRHREPRYTYTDANSTLPLYTYTKNAASLSLTCAF